MTLQKISRYFPLVLLLLTALYVTYSILPEKTWDYQSQESREKGFPVLTHEVKPGEYLRWKIDVCRYTDKEYVVERVIRNLESEREVLIDRVDDLDIKKGECKTMEREALVPFHAEPGRSIEISRYTTRKDSNNLNEDVEFRTETFHVAPLEVEESL